MTGNHLDCLFVLVAYPALLLLAGAGAWAAAWMVPGATPPSGLQTLTAPLMACSFRQILPLLRFLVQSCEGVWSGGGDSLAWGRRRRAPRRAACKQVHRLAALRAPLKSPMPRTQPRRLAALQKVPRLRPLEVRISSQPLLTGHHEAGLVEQCCTCYARNC